MSIKLPRYEARPTRARSSYQTWKLVRVTEPCPTCGHGEERVEIVAYAYYLMPPIEQEALMRSLADALNRTAHQEVDGDA